MVRIQLRALRKTFGAVVAVDDVDLDIAPAELFFLLGPSGCGKTTLLRCVAGFCRPDTGRIYFGERDITAVPAHKRNTSMVFQSYALWPHMTVADNVAFGLAMRRIARRERARLVRQMLQTVQMESLAERKPNQLSGGQQQRVALARALVIRPQCLLLDEPLSNLDAKLRLEMRDEIRQICKQTGVTAIYVTHDQKEALSMADRLAVFHDGRVEQTGPPQEIYQKPANRFVASFLGQANFLEATVLSRQNGQARLHTAIGEVTAAALPSGLHPESRVLCSIRPETLRLGEPPPAPVNLFKGELKDSVYLGEMAQHRLSAGTVELEVLELNPKHRGLPAGRSVSFWIDPADVVVLTG